MSEKRKLFDTKMRQLGVVAELESWYKEHEYLVGKPSAPERTRKQLSKDELADLHKKHEHLLELSSPHQRTIAAQGIEISLLRKTVKAQAVVINLYKTGNPRRPNWTFTAIEKAKAFYGDLTKLRPYKMGDRLK